MDTTYSDLDYFLGIDSDIIDIFLQFMAASGEIDLAHYDPLDTSISTTDMPASSTRDAFVYNSARTSRPLNLMSLPRDVLHEIYAMVLGPPTQVTIRNVYDLPLVQDSIPSPLDLFLVSRDVHREAASAFYGRTKFRVEHEWGVGFMTGRMGIDNCRRMHHVTVYMQYLLNMQLMIHSVFANLVTLNVLPTQAWQLGPWYDFLQGKHGGDTATALEEAVITSAETTSFGLGEYMQMSRHYAVTMYLPHWGKGGHKGGNPVWLLLTMKCPKWILA